MGQRATALGDGRGEPLAAGTAGWVSTAYAELHKVASVCLRRERVQRTLQPTALVHEVYLRLLRQRQQYQDEAQFLGVAAHLMRLILTDRARARLAEKRGGGAEHVELTVSLAGESARPDVLVSVDRALEQLAGHSPRQVQIVEMRFFAGLDETEIAEALGVSLRTVKRDWSLAKAFLYRSLQPRSLQS